MRRLICHSVTRFLILILRLYCRDYMIVFLFGCIVISINLSLKFVFRNLIEVFLTVLILFLNDLYFLCKIKLIIFAFWILVVVVLKNLGLSEFQLLIPLLQGVQNSIVEWHGNIGILVFQTYCHQENEIGAFAIFGSTNYVSIKYLCDFLWDVQSQTNALSVEFFARLKEPKQLK